MSRTLKEQMGLHPDPHAPEHTIAGGQRLTKIVTRNEYDSQQKGLPTYHRRIANPFPVFAIGVGASLLVLGLVLVEVRGLQNPQIYLNVGLPLGGIAVMTASMFSFAEGNTFLATAAGTLAGLLGGLSMIFIPWTGIKAAYAEEAGGNELMTIVLLYKATGILFFGAMIPVFLLFLASLRTAVPVAFSAFLIVIAAIVQGAVYLNYPMINAQKAAGALFIIVGKFMVFCPCCNP